MCIGKISLTYLQQNPLILIWGHMAVRFLWTAVCRFVLCELLTKNNLLRDHCWPAGGGASRRQKTLPCWGLNWSTKRVWEVVDGQYDRLPSRKYPPRWELFTPVTCQWSWCQAWLIFLSSSIDTDQQEHSDHWPVGQLNTAHFAIKQCSFGKIIHPGIHVNVFFSNLPPTSHFDPSPPQLTPSTG